MGGSRSFSGGLAIGGSRSFSGGFAMGSSRSFSAGFLRLCGSRSSAAVSRQPVVNKLRTSFSVHTRRRQLHN